MLSVETGFAKIHIVKDSKQIPGVSSILAGIRY